MNLRFSTSQSCRIKGDLFYDYRTNVATYPSGMLGCARSIRAPSRPLEQCEAAFEVFGTGGLWLRRVERSNSRSLRRVGLVTRSRERLLTPSRPSQSCRTAGPLSHEQDSPIFPALVCENLHDVIANQHVLGAPDELPISSARMVCHTDVPIRPICNENHHAAAFFSQDRVAECSAELTLAQDRGNEYQSLVQLYKALGGGWQQ